MNLKWLTIFSRNNWLASARPWESSWLAFSTRTVCVWQYWYADMFIFYLTALLSKLKSPSKPEFPTLRCITIHFFSLSVYELWGFFLEVLWWSNLFQSSNRVVERLLWYLSMMLIHSKITEYFKIKLYVKFVSKIWLSAHGTSMNRCERIFTVTTRLQNSHVLIWLYLPFFTRISHPYFPLVFSQAISIYYDGKLNQN